MSPVESVVRGLTSVVESDVEREEKLKDRNNHHDGSGQWPWPMENEKAEVGGSVYRLDSGTTRLKCKINQKEIYIEKGK